MSRLRDIQMHAIVYSPSAAGGPGVPKLELTPNMLNVVWQQGLNFPGQAAIALNRFDPKLEQIDYMKDHLKLFREDARATKCVFAGKCVKAAESSGDALVYAWDYTAFLQRSRTGYRTLYPDVALGSGIVTPEWAAAKAADKSLFEFVTTGTIQDPLGQDGVTVIKTNSEFGVVMFDRLFLFFALAEIGMANTDNTVVFEITRDEPHTFNFWKDRSVARGDPAFTFPGNLIDYTFDSGHDAIQNDLSTVILDSTTGEQVEYNLTNNPSKDEFRRLQGAVTIKTLFGITSGTTETDQQKAALARLLTISSGVPHSAVMFPRQGEVTPFHNFDLGDSFAVDTQRADRTGDRFSGELRMTGLAAAWSPNAGELLQVFLR